MKKTIIAILTGLTVLSNGLTAFAAPETMPDGTVFDAEYYAQMYPDVVAALGTDADALYQHYVNFGKAEGRLGFANDSADIVPKANNTVATDVVYPDYAFIQKLEDFNNTTIAPENKFIVSIEDTKGHTEKYYDKNLLGDEQTAFMYFNECVFDDNKFEIRFYTETGEFYFGWSREMNESGKYNLGPVVSSGVGPLTRMLVVCGNVNGNFVAYYSNWFTVTVDTSLAWWLPSDELYQSFHRSATKN